jgi:hypothetical protein
MKKTVKVVMLPTINPSPLGYHFDTVRTGSVDYAPNFGFEVFHQEKNFQHKPQHLYLTSDDKIKEGDYCIDGLGGLFGPYEEGDTVDFGATMAHKVIATTDNSLLLPTISFKDWDGKSRNLPQIPESFIQAYAKANGDIVEVQVETGMYHDGKFIDDGKTRSFTPIERLKLHPDNTVIIAIKTREDNTAITHQTKKTYSREEVLYLLDRYDERFFIKSHSISREKWIEENL